MNILGIDTSSENLSLCIEYENKILTNKNQKIKFGASSLISCIDKVLKRHSLNLSNFDAFVIGQGPGSFTGLRISFSIIKAFVLATKRPAISIGSFFSCAYQVRNFATKIAVITDAKRGFFYFGSFLSKGGTISQDLEVKLVRACDIPKRDDYLFISYEEGLEDKMKALYPKIKFYPDKVYPKAKYLLPFAESRYIKKRYTPIEKLIPLYLHPKTCQIKKKI